MGGFLPPVIFTITANAAQAMASFGKVNTQLKAMEAQALKTGKALTGTEKALHTATAAAKAFSMVAIAFAAYGVKEIMSLQAAYTRLGQTMSAVGVSTEANRKQMADAAQSMENLGFDAANASDALNILLQTTKDVEKSQKLLGMAGDLARARQMDLSTAARLLSRAQSGNARLFTMFGITLDKTKDKATATKEAMQKLADVLHGQAEAYTKTFQGQLEVLGKQVENLAEGIGATLLPYLQKFIVVIQKLGKFLADHKAILVAIGTVITTVLIVAVVNLTKKLYQMAAAWVAANLPMMAVVATIAAVGAAFVWAWNKFEGFRKAIVAIGKAFITFGQVIFETVMTIVNVFLLLVRGVANLQIAMGKLFNNKEQIKTGKETLDMIDNFNAKAKEIDKSFDGAKKKLDALVDTKIDLSKLKLPSLKIADFGLGDGGDGGGGAGGAGGAISDAMVGALQHIKDFNDALKQTDIELNDVWSTITGKDFEAAIKEGLTNPVDKLVQQAQKAVNVFQGSSNKYQSALDALKIAQDNYAKVVDSTDKAVVAAAESALSSAEDLANKLGDSMKKSLDDVLKYQDDMINAIVDTHNKINDLEKERTQVLVDAELQRRGIEKDYYIRKKQLEDDYTKSVLNAQQEAAKRSADIIKQSVDMLRSTFKSATYRTVGDIFDALTYQGRYIKGGTTQKILNALGLQAGKAKVLADDAATLAGLGFSQTFIEEVVAQGPDIGHSLAQTIITSTPESINQMRQYWEDLQKVSTHGVDNVAQRLNSGIVLATEELTAQLAQVGIDLKDTLSQLEYELTDNLAKAWLDYSDALDEINRKTTQQISEIDAQITDLNNKINQLRYALTAIGTVSAPGVVAQAPNLIKPVTPAIVPIPLAPSVADAELATLINKQNQSQGVSQTVIVNPVSQASAQDIADEVAWAIRTSGDVKYVTAKTMTAADRAYIQRHGTLGMV